VITGKAYHFKNLSKKSERNQFLKALDNTQSRRQSPPVWNGQPSQAATCQQTAVRDLFTASETRQAANQPIGITASPDRSESDSFFQGMGGAARLSMGLAQASLGIGIALKAALALSGMALGLGAALPIVAGAGAALGAYVGWQSGTGLSDFASSLGCKLNPTKPEVAGALGSAAAAVSLSFLGGGPVAALMTATIVTGEGLVNAGWSYLKNHSTSTQ
jgi:hypothetical protein